MEAEEKAKSKREYEEKIAELQQSLQKKETEFQLQEIATQSHLQEIESLQSQLSSFIPHLEEVWLEINY